MRMRMGVIVAAVLLVGLLAGPPCSAQLEENLGGMTDKNAEGYLAPLDAGLSATLNSAIFRTGHVPESGLTFTVGIAAMAMSFDDADRTYTPTDPTGFTSLEPTEVPTVIGDLEGKNVAGEGGLYQAYPGGFDMEGFELAVPQLTIGAVAGTRALLRYVAVDLGDTELGNLSYFGIGAQHSISQWFDNFPVDLAAGFFIHSFELGEDLIKTTAYQLNVTASRMYANGHLQPYVGLGYDSLQSDVKYTDEDSADLSLDASLEGENNFHFTLGAQAKTSIVSIYAEFNAAAGTGFALGLDFGN